MREILPQWSGWERQPDLCKAALAVLVKLGPLMLSKPPNQISEWLRCVFRCAAHVSVTDDDDPDDAADDPLPLAPEVMHLAGDGANVLLRVRGGDHAQMGAGELVLRVVVIAGVDEF